MKAKKTNYIFLVFILFILKASEFKAQNLVVALDFGIFNSFPIANIESIKFGVNTMTLKQNNGTTTTWNIQGQIAYYYFSPSAGIEESSTESDVSLNFFPNPCSGDLKIQFISEVNSIITIEILDSGGKRLFEVYSGSHQGIQTYQWNRNLANGVYYCRISTDKKTISKPFIVNQ
jgi:hypothetical protein